MRGSRMRDRRPPSNPWDCGTRAANISRRRAILMAFNTPFALAGVTSSTSCITAYRRCFVHGRDPSPTTGPGTSDVGTRYSFTAVAACPRPGPFQPLAGPGTSDLLSFFTASSLSSSCPRPSGQFVVMPTSCSALVDPFLAMSETLPPLTTDVYFSHYRFSVPGNQRLSLHAIGSSSATACSTLSRSSKWASRPVRCSSCRSP